MSVGGRFSRRHIDLLCANWSIIIIIYLTGKFRKREGKK